jgi:hypothetical protein
MKVHVVHQLAGHRWLSRRLVIEHEEEERWVTIRITEKINEMEEEFGYLREEFDQSRKERKVPLPLEVIKEDSELDEGMGSQLDNKGVKIEMSLVGKIGYIATTIRYDIRFGYLIISRKLACPRRWDLHLAVWIMEYLIASKDVPLILGGEDVSLVALGDASFGTLSKGKSVKAHMLKTNLRSGAIYVHCGIVKNIVTSVWEAEINPASDAYDTITYCINVCSEISYPIGFARVMVDNHSAIDWLNGENIHASTRHVGIRMFR